MPGYEELLTELADREAIRDLPVRYRDCVWQNALDAMIDLFAKDGQFISKGRKREFISKGHAELRKMYAGALGEVNPRPISRSRGRFEKQDDRERAMLRRAAQREEEFRTGSGPASMTTNMRRLTASGNSPRASSPASRCNRERNN